MAPDYTPEHAHNSRLYIIILSKSKKLSTIFYKIKIEGVSEQEVANGVAQQYSLPSTISVIGDKKKVNSKSQTVLAFFLQWKSWGSVAKKIVASRVNATQIALRATQVLNDV